jgi:hypothetical protein
LNIQERVRRLLSTMDSFRALYISEPSKAIRFLDFFLNTHGVRYKYRNHSVVSSISGALYSYKHGKHFTTFQEWIESTFGIVVDDTTLFMDIYVGKQSLTNIIRSVTAKEMKGFHDMKFRSFNLYNYLKGILTEKGIPVKEKETYKIVWNNNQFAASLLSVTSSSKSPLDILQAYEADILENVWYLPEGSPTLVCLLPKQEKMKPAEPEKAVVASSKMNPLYVSPPYSPLLPSPGFHGTADHFLFQSNVLNKAIQDIGYLQQICQKQQQIIERLEGRLAAMEAVNTGTRLSALEDVNTEQRLGFLESLVPPSQPAPVTYLPVYPMNSMPQMQQPMDPMSAMMQAIQMAQMVHTASQQSAMANN